jgi:HSP20 family molecular chaperone IbpA
MSEELRKTENTDVAQSPEEAQDLPVFRPRVDIVESDEAVILTADMPGITEQDVDVNLERNTLSIRGTFSESAPDGYTLQYREYRSGHYERTFTLGNTIDRSGIEANVKDGVLTVRLPKAKEVQPKRIAVQAG